MVRFTPRSETPAHSDGYHSLRILLMIWKLQAGYCRLSAGPVGLGPGATRGSSIGQKCPRCKIIGCTSRPIVQQEVGLPNSRLPSREKTELSPLFLSLLATRWTNRKHLLCSVCNLFGISPVIVEGKTYVRRITLC